jgi:hypothetical protein
MKRGWVRGISSSSNGPVWRTVAKRELEWRAKAQMLSAPARRSAPPNPAPAASDAALPRFT